MTTIEEHWNQIYASTPTNHLGWYEPVPAPSLHLLGRCGLSPEDSILDVGAGEAFFIDALLEQGFKHLFALDISSAALRCVQERLGPERAAQVTWLVEDITRPEALSTIEPLAFWHDRAVLHFFTEEAQRQAYLSALRRSLRQGGYAMIAEYAVGGAQRCSGLDLRNYDRASLAAWLGDDFSLVDSLDHLFTMPSGDLRPYIYTLWRRM